MSEDTQHGVAVGHCYCGGEYDHFEYHHPDGCALKPLAPDLEALQEGGHAQ
jgi:hypothetical protein